MEETNELNDIILNKSNTNSSNKKIILAVATLGVILVIVVMLMNSLSSNGTDNLPQAALPPKPDIENAVQSTDEPLFEDVQVIEENSADDNLNDIARKLKAESAVIAVNKKKTVTKKPIVRPKPHTKKPVVSHSTVKKSTSRHTVSREAKTGSYYIQVGSFSKYKPNKKFLKSITDLHYNYKYHKMTVNGKTLNKVLVGPFSTRAAAKKAKTKVRTKIEPGAFLIKL